MIPYRDENETLRTPIVTIIIIGFPGLGGSSLTVTRGIHSGIARMI